MNKDIIQPSKAASTVTSNITPQKSTIEFYPYLVEKVYFQLGVMAMPNTAGIAGLGANYWGNYVVLDEILLAGLNSLCLKARGGQRQLI